MKKNLEIKALVGMFVVGFLLVGGYFSATTLREKRTAIIPTPTPTKSAPPIPGKVIPMDMSGWNTYTNTKYGYRYKYPDEYELGSSPFQPVTQTQVQSVNKKGVTPSERITIFSNSDRGCSGIESCTENLKNILGVKKENIVAIYRGVGETRVSGFGYYTSNNAFVEYYLLSNKAGRVFKIKVVTTDSTNYETENPIINAILGTFRFTK